MEMWKWILVNTKRTLPTLKYCNKNEKTVNILNAYIEKTIRAFLQGDLENEIIKIKENIITMKNQHEIFKSEEETLSLLQSNVIQKIESLQQIGRIDIATE